VVLNTADTLPDTPALFAVNSQAPWPAKLVQASFTVEFSTEHSLSAKQSNGIGSSVTQNTELVLKGLEPAQMQAITDAAYAAFLQEAKNAGAEVVSKDQLLATDVYKAAMASGKPSGLLKESAGLKLASYAPTGMVINGLGLAPGATDYQAASGGAFGALSALAGVASVVGDISAATTSAKALEGLPAALGGAQVMSVRLSVYFAELKGEFGDRPSALLSAGTQSKLGLYIDPRNSLIALGGADKPRSVNLKATLLVSGEPFKAVEDDSPTGRNVGLAVLGMLAGGNTSNRTTRKNVVVDPAAYADLAGTALAETAPLVFAALKTAP
jgi:hypothetical protein